MTKILVDEATVKLAIDAFESCSGAPHWSALQPALTALREALAEQPQCQYPKCSYPCPDLPDCRDAEQPAQQEPVAIALNTGTKQGVKWLKNVEHGQSLYTTPPAAPVQELDHGDELTIAYMSGVHRGKELAAQRTWVGLTDEQIDQGLCRTPYAMKTAEAWREGVRWAYHQLKEKNT
jgi:hypothetical protein